MKPISKINVTDYELNKIQDNVDAAFNQVVRSRIVDGNLLVDIDLVAGSANSVNHGLSRVPVMVLPSAPSAQSTVWVTAKDSRTLTVWVSNNCTCSLWVA